MAKKGRTGKRLFAGYLTTDSHRHIRQAALDLGETNQSILIEALNLWLNKRYHGRVE